MTTLGAPLCHPWWTILCVFRTWWDLGAQLGLRLGLVYFDSSGAGLWTSFSTLLSKARKRYKKRKKKRAEMDAFSMASQVFPGSWKVRFDCAGASGLRFRPLLFLALCLHFLFFFFASFFELCGPLWATRFMGSAREPAPQSMSLIEAHA